MLPPRHHSIDWRPADFLPAGLLLVGLLAGLPAGATQDGPAVRVSGGFFDVGELEYDIVEVGFEVQMRAFGFGFLPPRWQLSPVFGLGLNEEDGGWVYGGLRFNLRFAGRGWLGLSSAAGLYDEGGGKELGGPVEFRSALELAVEVTPGHRLGITFHHLSNAGLYDDNPGSNSLLMTYTRSLARAASP